ncbi:Sir2 family NAD-dependent protein deacetylase [Actinomycetospora sp. NBRC 106378]|uniref:SIR2 family NAD-dependent protein deacylase n=1 Tax=Actinomycetospora sp. NBRC 106378 TaxID=3032208 RepID=UPI0024A455BB|nr:Sir2 family NAD-dependent protein deacetylase [Actinomycetospora sp. NBRC 106378]GLZ51425.1 NAD-dependent protein deacetylase 2 [Actinomycetospora sp. NBRC 106378]
MADDIERARELIAGAQRITVLTGAGVSTDSGIPDFRGPQGVWTLNPAAELIWNYDNYVADPEVRRTAWQERVEHPMFSAVPGRAHQALVDLERSGKLFALLTQNIDELHQKAGSSPSLVAELHGSNHGTVCLTCGAIAPMADALARVRAGDDDPACERCGGILKATTIMFGEMLDADVLMRAREAAIACDLFLAVGTSLGVHPAAGLVDIAAQVGAEVIIVNAEPTPYDPIASVVLRGGISEVLPEVLRR